VPRLWIQIKIHKYKEEYSMNFEEEILYSKCNKCEHITRRDYLNTTLLYCNKKKSHWYPKIEYVCTDYTPEPYKLSTKEKWNRIS